MKTLRKLFWRIELASDVVAAIVTAGVASLLEKLRLYRASERCWEYCLRLGINVSEICRQVFNYDIKECQSPDIVEAYKYAYEYFGYEF